MQRMVTCRCTPHCYRVIAWRTCLEHMRRARQNGVAENDDFDSSLEAIDIDDADYFGSNAMDIEDFQWPEQSLQGQRDNLLNAPVHGYMLEERNEDEDIGGDGNRDEDEDQNGDEDESDSDDDDEGSQHFQEGEHYDAETEEDAGLHDGEEEHGDVHPMMESPLLQEPLYPGSQMTLKQALLHLLALTAQNKHTQQSIGDLLRVVGLMLPEGHLLPPTTYKLFKLLGLHVDDYERHVCENDCHVFPVVNKSEYGLHLEEICPECEAPRFERKGSVWGPTKKFYSLPLAPQLAALKKRPEFDHSVGKMWASLAENGTFYDTFWGGSIAEPLLQQCEDLDSFSQLLVLCLGMDSVNAFKSSHSVTPVGIRIWNLHPEERGSKSFVLLAALVPGPKVPSNLGAYLVPLLDEIIASQTEPIVIYNANLQREERITLKLATSIQDQISQIKSTEHIGPSGRCNCWRCQRESQAFEGTNGGSYQTGYNDESAFTAAIKTNDEARQKSQQVENNEISKRFFKKS